MPETIILVSLRGRERGLGVQRYPCQLQELKAHRLENYEEYDTHISNCSHVPRSIGRLKMVRNSELNRSDSRSDFRSKRSSESSITHYKVGVMSTDIKWQTKVAFASAIHRTAAPFCFFSYSALETFLKLPRPACNPVPAQEIGGPLLDMAYDRNMSNAILYIQKHGGGNIGIDGATIVSYKSMRTS